MDASELGMTQEEMAERVIDRIAEKAMRTCGILYDPDDEESTEVDTRLAQRLDAAINARIDADVKVAAAKVFMPAVETRVFQTTNMWGESTGDVATFTEHIIAKANAYMAEKVDKNGKAKKKGDSYQWIGIRTRLEDAIHRLLHDPLKEAMSIVVKTNAAAFLESVQKVAKDSLAQTNLKISTTVKTQD